MEVCPSPLTINCGDNISPMILGYPSIMTTDACLATFEYFDVENLDNTGAGTISRIFTALSDNCEEPDPCTQIITVNNNTSEIVLNCPCQDDPADCTFICFDYDNITAVDENGKIIGGPQATAMVDCGEVNIEVVDEIIEGGGDCDLTIINRTFIATDFVGNSAACNIELIIEPAIDDNSDWVNSIDFPLNWDGTDNHNPVFLCGTQEIDLTPLSTGVPTLAGWPLYLAEVILKLLKL